MTIFASLHKRNALFFAILFIPFFTFTADVVDLREELRIIPCQSSCLDDNIETGITGGFVFDTGPSLILRPIFSIASLEISFLHLLPHGFRAPPYKS